MSAQVWQWIFRASGGALLLAITGLIVLPHTQWIVYVFSALGVASASMAAIAVRRTRDIEQMHALADADRLHDHLATTAQAELDADD